MEFYTSIRKNENNTTKLINEVSIRRSMSENNINDTKINRALDTSGNDHDNYNKDSGD